MDAGHLLVGDALGAQPLGAVGVRALRAHRADVAGVRLQRGLERRDVELVVVREDADGRSLVHVRAREELVGPLDDQLVHVGEALARDELGARVADGHPVAEEAAHLGDRGGVVDRAEDVHVRPRREGRDEELPLGRVDDPGLAAGEELRRRAVVIGADEPLRADVLAGDPDLERDRPLLAHRLDDRDDDLGVEAVDEDVDGPAAREGRPRTPPRRRSRTSSAGARRPRAPRAPRRRRRARRSRRSRSRSRRLRPRRPTRRRDRAEPSARCRPRSRSPPACRPRPTVRA